MFSAGNIGIKPYDGFSDPNVFINSFVCKWEGKDKAEAIKHLLTKKAERVYEKVTDKTKIDIYKELPDKCGLSNSWIDYRLPVEIYQNIPKYRKSLLCIPRGNS